MKKSLLIIAVATMSVFTMQTKTVNAQACTPSATCVDIIGNGNEHGEICPDTLPQGFMGAQYMETVTILPPDSGDAGDGLGMVKIHHITLDAVENIPPGLTYALNDAGDWYPGTKYCALISGTPITHGTYKLRVKVTPYVNSIAGPVASTQVIDTTSLFIKINWPDAIGENSSEKFNVIVGSPNPFNYSTKIGYYTKTNSPVKLEVYDLVGNKVHTENMNPVYGEYYFGFNGSDLKNGIYIYKITSDNKTYSKRLIKS